MRDSSGQNRGESDGEETTNRGQIKSRGKKEGKRMEIGLYTEDGSLIEREKRKCGALSSVCSQDISFLTPMLHSVLLKAAVDSATRWRNNKKKPKQRERE